MTLLLAADFGLGWVWQQAADDPAPPRLEIARTGITLELGRTSAVLDGPDAQVFPDDPREDLPAMEDYAWRHAYFQELQRAPSIFWPYVMWRPMPATGTYINILDSWERVTYRSPDSTGAEVPDVDFYGGSTTYGEGQRDEHTIASEVVRLAARDGLPIRAHNRGVGGWVIWQELFLFEQLSADETTKPDLALFYDGANELDAQSQSIRGVPAHTVLDDIAAKLAGDSTRSADRPDTSPSTTWDILRLMAQDYRDTSAVARTGRWLRGAVTGEPAGAAPVEEPGYEFVPDIYRRGQALVSEVARQREIPVLFFWQPLQRGGWDGYRDGLAAPTIDLSRTFVDHDDIFIDGTHHNEAGSVIAATAIWEHLRPLVVDWYASR